MDNAPLIVKSQNNPLTKQEKKEKAIKAMHTFLNFKEH